MDTAANEPRQQESQSLSSFHSPACFKEKVSAGCRGVSDVSGLDSTGESYYLENHQAAGW